MMSEELQKKTDILHNVTKEECIFSNINKNLLMKFEEMRNIKGFVAQPSNLLWLYWVVPICLAEMVHHPDFTHLIP